VFLLNSRLGLFTAAPLGSLEQVLKPEGASLLPKLRDYFAEFLNEKSLERLRIFSLPTCVGLRYGHQTYSLRGFSWQRGIKKLACPKARFPAFLRECGRPDFPCHPSYDRGQPSDRLYLYPSASPHHSNACLVVQEY
jgi:hypothetical protein